MIVVSQKAEKCVYIVDGISALRAGNQMEATNMFEVVTKGRPDSVLAAATLALEYLHTPAPDGRSNNLYQHYFLDLITR